MKRCTICGKENVYTSNCSRSCREENSRIRTDFQNKQKELEKDKKKICVSCGEIRDLNQFSKDGTVKSRISGRCKFCDSVKWKKWYTPVAKDPVENLIVKKCCTCKKILLLCCFSTAKSKRDGKQSRCRECCKIVQRRIRKENVTKIKETRLLKEYGITLAQQNDLLQSQENKCAICFSLLGPRANTDHCHKTGKVRGMLCYPCNAMLGYAKDNIETLQNAIEYLKKNA